LFFCLFVVVVVFFVFVSALNNPSIWLYSEGWKENHYITDILFQNMLHTLLVWSTDNAVQ
jgi:hypothetical protein